jgi:2-polyprenyl-3-methyl-5-hydroxy-6-metoxy-1,4-benzoquinol methylase
MDDVMHPANDLAVYEREAAAWWDATSPAFRSLHAVNGLRTDLFAERLGNRHTGRVVVDLGRGGGRLSQFFVDAGARVVEFDISAASSASRAVGTRANS